MTPSEKTKIREDYVASILTESVASLIKEKLGPHLSLTFISLLRDQILKSFEGNWLKSLFRKSIDQLQAQRQVKAAAWASPAKWPELQKKSSFYRQLNLQPSIRRVFAQYYKEPAEANAPIEPAPSENWRPSRRQVFSQVALMVSAILLAGYKFLILDPQIAGIIQELAEFTQNH